MRCSASKAKNERKWADLLGPQNRPYRPTTTATATTAITGSARVASVGFHGVYELAVYANMDPIRSALCKGAVETSALNALALDGRVPTALLAHTMYITRIEAAVNVASSTLVTKIFAC